MSRLDTLRRIASEKEVEIVRQRAELAAAPQFLHSLLRSIRALEVRAWEEPADGESADPIVRLRALILDAGRPLYIDDILRALGQPLNRYAREDLRALPRPWLQRGEIFTRPRPSTFGLVELRRAGRPTRRSTTGTTAG